MQRLTLQDWITSSGKYPWRAKHKELTDDVKKKAQILVDKQNAALDDLEYKGPRKYSSGFRPSDVNKKTKGASKTSTHMSGEGGDIEDIQGVIDFLFRTNEGVLKKHDLYLEDPKYTETWSHTQYRPTKSGKRVFIP